MHNRRSKSILYDCKCGETNRRMFYNSCRSCCKACKATVARLYSQRERLPRPTVKETHPEMQNRKIQTDEARYVMWLSDAEVQTQIEQTFALLNDATTFEEINTIHARAIKERTSHEVTNGFQETLSKLFK